MSQEFTDQPYPDAGWVTKQAQRRPSTPVYGLFVYPNSYRRYAEAIHRVGWKYFRMGGSPSKSDIKGIHAQGGQVSVHIALAMRRENYSSDEEFLQAAEKSTRARLARYPSVGVAHVWNEPNFGYLMSQGTLRDKALLYGQLLTRVSKIIRSHSPLVTILGFETGRAMPNASDFISLVYEMFPDIHWTYDVMALHPGVDPVAPEADHVKSWGRYSIARHVQSVRTIWRRLHLGSKPIWFAEGGWSISSDDGGNYYRHPSTVVSLAMQAAYACRYYAMALRLGVERVSTFFVEDTDGLNSGFFDARGPRPSARAVGTMIKVMPNPVFLGALAEGEDGVYSYVFRADADDLSKGGVVMSWTTGADKTLWLGRGTLVRPMGAESDLRAGQPTVVGQHPVFLKVDK